MSGPLGKTKLDALRDALRTAVPGARHGVLPFGDARVDGCLPGGGLPLGQLHEIAADGVAAETGAAAAGFIACLLTRLLARRADTLPSGGRPTEPRPVFWIAPVCDLHAPGLLVYGLDPGRLILVHAADDAATLAAMETALRGGAAAAVVGEVGALARTPSRRLQLACLKCGTTGFVLRRWPWGRRAVDRETSAAATRWRIAPLPSGPAAWGTGPREPLSREPLSREPGLPRWSVTLEHARGGTEGGWILEPGDPRNEPGHEPGNEPGDEKEGSDATHALRVVAELADPAIDPARRLPNDGARRRRAG